MQMNLKRVLLSLCAVAGILVQAAAPSFVTSEAALWLDASTLAAEPGTELDTWADVRGGSYPVATSYQSVKPQVIEIADGDLAGKKAVTFFSAGTMCDMQFTRLTNIKTVFLVVDIDQSGAAFWLGDTTSFNFHRGNNGEYWYNHSATANTAYYNDGRLVANPGAVRVPTGYQLVTYVRTGTSVSQASCLTRDRTISGRIGGKRLCELIVFERALGVVEQSRVEGYLKSKWFGGAGQAVAASEMLGNKAQVRFDASVAESFHHDVEANETAVSQWDDLSGNANHFVAFHLNANDPQYGAVTTVNTCPAFNTGAAGSRIDFKLTTRLTNTRTVVLVGDVERNAAVFWLGDTTDYRFHRGTGGQYALNNNNNYLYTVGKVWKNGVRVANKTTEFPDYPGGPSVYVLQIPANCAWTYLGNDRSISGRNGGKKVCELMTFNTDFSEADCLALSELMAEKWTPAVDGLLAQAAVHVDAAKRDNFNYDGEAISGWKNTGTGNDLTATVCYQRSAVVPGAWDYTNGVPAFLMGRVASGIDMGYTRITDLRSVFWVMDIAKDRGAFFLGDMAAYHFHRGTAGQYSGPYGGFRDGEQYCDGTRVAAPLNEVPPDGLHVFNVMLTGNCASDRLTRDRDCHDNGIARDGGRALSELILFRTPVTGLPMLALQRHLQAKWRETSGWRPDDGEWGAEKYRVFDADATVPAEGASAEGLGVNRTATIAGGPLTLGAGGVFAAADTVATVAAPLASGTKLVAGGPGTVVLAQPAETSEIFVNRGTTLQLALYGSVAGPVTLCEGAKIVFDAAQFEPGRHVALALDALHLPAGAVFSDYVTVTDPDHNAITLSDDGTELIINDPKVPVSATWVGNGDRAVTLDPANWICYSASGTVLEGTVPVATTWIEVAGETTLNVPAGQTLPSRDVRLVGARLAADCDWRGLDLSLISGDTLDLNGHRLDIAGFSDTVAFTDTSSATAAKYFKLVLRKDYFCSDGMSQLSEFALYAADGTRLNLNLADAGTTAPNALAAGSFSLAEAYRSGTTESAVKMFDGNTGTKWGPQGSLADTYDNEAAWRIVYLRLADDAQPVASYNIFTANDSPNRQPSSWDLYASANGTDWTLVDRRKGLARLGTFYQPISPAFPLVNGAPGELHIDVPEGTTIANTSVNLSGNLRLVKDGAGVFVASCAGQSYAGDTVVRAGTVKQGLDGGNFPFGVSGADVVVEEGGTFDLNGKNGAANANLRCAGGLVVNTANAGEGGSGFGAFNLDCDTTLNISESCGIGNGVSDLGGHTLTVNLANAKVFCLFNEGGTGSTPYNWIAFKNGLVKITSGGYFKIWSDFDCRTADFDLNCAMYMCWRTDVRNLTWRYGGNYGVGPAGYFAVHGTFTPLGTHFFRTTLLDGATLDLSAKDAPWSTTSALVQNGANVCSFAAGATITVDVHGRHLKSGEALVNWTTDTAPAEDVKFVLDEQSTGFGRKLKVKTDGLYYEQLGVMIYLR